MYRQFLLVLSSLSLISGCASANKNGSDPDLSSEPSITYSLPVTALKVKVDILLLDCQNGVLTAEPTVTLTPAAMSPAHEKHKFTLKGSHLKSFTKKRELGITLHEHGGIKTINSSVADETPKILGSIIKTASLFFGLSGNQAISGTGSCNKETTDALKSAKDLQEKIFEKRDNIRSVGYNAEKLEQAIDLMASELAQIQAKHLKLSKSVVFIPPNTVLDANKDMATQYLVLKWGQDDVKKWANTATPLDPKESLTIGLCVYSANRNVVAVCNSDRFASKGSGTLPKLEYKDIECKACEDTIVFREPISASVKAITLDGTTFARRSTRIVFANGLYSTKAKTEEIEGDQVLKSEKFEISQWGEPSYFPLKVGFGGSKSLSMSLNEFGRPTSFGWKSDARGAAVTGALASSLEAVDKIIDAEKGESLAEKKAKISELETQQKLNKLRACEEIIQNGGYSCPD